MKNIEKIQKELDALKVQRTQVIIDNSVICNSPKIKRTFKYRDSIIIKSQDLCNL